MVITRRSRSLANWPAFIIENQQFLVIYEYLIYRVIVLNNFLLLLRYLGIPCDKKTYVKGNVSATPIGLGQHFQLLVAVIQTSSVYAPFIHLKSNPR